MTDHMTEFSAEERKSLPTHVTMCGLRYQSLIAGQKRTERWVIAIFTVLVIGQGYRMIFG